MSEKHTSSFDYFDLAVEVGDDGNVSVEFAAIGDGLGRIKMGSDDLSEVVAFVERHAQIRVYGEPVG